MKKTNFDQNIRSISASVILASTIAIGSITAACAGNFSNKISDRVERTAWVTQQIAQWNQPEQKIHDLMNTQREQVAAQCQHDMKLNLAKQLYELQHEDASEENDPFLQFCNSWDLTDLYDYFRMAVIYKEFDFGTMYILPDVYVYIPKECGPETKYCVHFAGGNGAHIFRPDYAEGYVKSFKPNAIFIWFKSSGIDELGGFKKKTAGLLKQLSQMTGVAPSTIHMTSSSNGGYTTFHVAASLYQNYGIITKDISNFDVGMNWGITSLLPKEDDCQSLRDMNTVVYAFGRTGEIVTYLGAKEFFKSRVPVYEVGCLNGDHDRITRIAFRNGTLSWVIGEQEELDPNEYTITKVN